MSLDRQSPAIAAQKTAGPAQSAALSLPAWGDLAGMTASVACAVHCALVPLFIGYLPALGLSWLVGKGFHQGMTALCFLVAVLAFVPGYRKHRRIRPALLGAVGVGVLATEAFGFAEMSCSCCTTAVCVQETALAGTALLPWELLGLLGPWLPPLGGAFLITAHLANHQAACRCCASGHQGHHAHG